MFEIMNDPDKKGGFKSGTRIPLLQAKNMLKDGIFSIGTQVMITEKEALLKKKPDIYWVYDGYPDQVLFSHQKQFQAAGIALLEKYSWRAILTGDTKRSPSGMRGFPDLICLNINMVAFIEVKFGNDYMTKKQNEFEEIIDPLTGSHLFYKIATRLDDFREVAQHGTKKPKHT